jgi:hypothetical protein
LDKRRPVGYRVMTDWRSSNTKRLTPNLAALNPFEGVANDVRPSRKIDVRNRPVPLHPHRAAASSIGVSNMQARRRGTTSTRTGSASITRIAPNALRAGSRVPAIPRRPLRNAFRSPADVIRVPLAIMTIMGGLNSLGLSRLSLDSDNGPTMSYVLTQHPLRRVLAFARRSIDDVVNSRAAKREVFGYFKLHRRIERTCESVDLERQWNPEGMRL